MKSFYLSLIIALTTVGISSCSKKVEEVKLRKNCIGVYLHFDGEDFLVDNPEIFEEYENNDILQVRYSDMNAEAPIYADSSACFVLFEFDKRVKVKSVKTN